VSLEHAARQRLSVDDVAQPVIVTPAGAHVADAPSALHSDVFAQ
jgi:hypothetical protein